MPTQNPFESWAQAWDMEKMSKMQQENMAAMQKAGEIMTKCTQSCMQQASDMAQGAMKESMATMQSASSAKGIEEMMQQGQNFLQKAATQNTENCRKMAEEMGKAGQQAADVMTKQAQASMTTAMDLLSKAAQSSSAK